MAENPDQTNYHEIGKKLDIIIRLLAQQIIAQHETIETKAVALRSSGIMPAEIAKICGTTPNTVRVALTLGKKKGKKKHAR